MIDLSRYVFETLRADEELAFRRGRSGDGELPNILLVAPVSEHPVAGIFERLEHEYSLRHELESDWAARRSLQRDARSEEHTSELQSRQYLVCRLLLEKKTER